MNYLQNLILGKETEVKARLRKLLKNLGVESEMINFVGFEINDRHTLLKIKSFNLNKDNELVIWLTNFNLLHSSVNTYTTEDNKMTINNSNYPLDNSVYIKLMGDFFPNYKTSYNTYMAAREKCD